VAAIITGAASWSTLLIAVLIYGFAPGFLLRLIVLTYEKDDPRRLELVAELYAVPRHKRPFWVAEQLETAIFDGLGPRAHWALSGRVINRWKLRSGVDLHDLHPGTFWIPSEEEKGLIGPGDVAKLIFAERGGWSERMWVEVVKIGRRKIVGELVNEPLGFYRLHAGKKVRFRHDHIIDYELDPHTQQKDRSQSVALCNECKGRNEPDPHAEFDLE